MSEEKSSPIGIIIIVVAAVIITGCASGKSAGENKQTNTKKPEKPAGTSRLISPETSLKRVSVKFRKPSVGAQFAIRDSMQNTAKQYLNGQLKSGQSLNGKGSYVTKILSIENGEPKTVEITKIKNVISAKQNGRPQDVNINDPDARLVFRHQGGKWRLDEAASKTGSKSKYSAKIVANFYDGGGEGVPTIAGHARLFPDHPVKIGDTWQPNLTGSLFRVPGKTTCKLEEIRKID